MKYEKTVEAKFIERENRFVARVCLSGGETCSVHVRNTGRCRELLLPGARVYLEDHIGRMGTRKLRYSLVAVEKGTLLINLDSQAPNKVVQEALEDGKIQLPGLADTTLARIRPETKFGNSRFDFCIETAEPDVRKAFIEVKGVTLEEDGHARFPDAPTQRGVKHINELIRAREEGHQAYIIFIVQMEGMTDVSPNYETHPQFGETLAKAAEAGVKILAFDCIVTPDSLEVKGQIPFTF